MAQCLDPAPSCSMMMKVTMNKCFALYRRLARYSHYHEVYQEIPFCCKCGLLLENGRRQSYVHTRLRSFTF
ncbi:hypothetical protein FOFC_20858 [Fusarium oxysporum]|nr:hypothetical protein FOFC_20858 [Fusarium oxysporum]